VDIPESGESDGIKEPLWRDFYWEDLVIANIHFASEVNVKRDLHRWIQLFY